MTRPRARPEPCAGNGEVVGELHSIWIAERAAGPLRSVRVVRAIAGVGLEGDRYASQRGTFSRRASTSTRDLSLIDRRTVEDVLRESGRAWRPGDLRRNLVVECTTAGDPLAWIGAKLRIGDVVLACTGPCPPCGHLERLLDFDVRTALHGRGGLRARIVTGGLLRAGATIEVEDPARSLP